jgi:competence protein ComEA
MAEAQNQKPRAGRGRQAVASTAASTGGINVNTAGADDLVQVPGIGPKMAERIIAHREKSGPFTSLEQLMNVKGIGEKKLARLRPFLVVDAPAGSR